jgi:hypothetical protein
VKTYVPHPRSVSLSIEATGADYVSVSQALFDKKKAMVEGFKIGTLTFRGKICGLTADLLEKAEKEEDWKWLIHIELTPRVRLIQRGDSLEELDEVTREVGTELGIVEAWYEAQRKKDA